MSTADTVVLIHGLWMTPLSWEHWMEHYNARGMNVIARAWPGLEGDVDQIRRDPTAMVNIGVGEVVEHYERIIKALDNPPIIMGHSTGGLVTQILLDHGLGSAGVAIDPAPVKGIFLLPWSTLKVSFPVLKNPANNHKAVTLTPEEFHYAFTNTLTPEESRRIYDRYAVPGPGRIIFQAALANLNPNAPTRVDFRNDSRAPLLIIGGGEDHLCPPRVTRGTAKLQHKSKAITAYREFPGRSHYTLGQAGWEQVADFALDWALHPRDLDQRAA
jgi:alpha-beta hydrolase superfamily lysophospholipase